MRRWPAGWRTCAAAVGWRRSGWARCPAARSAEQIAAWSAGLRRRRLADDLYARAEGNPFFTEQLVAAALAGPAGGGLHVPAGLPDRLTELLLARVGHTAVTTPGRCWPALAVAGRPLTEDQLCEVTGLGTDAVRGGLRELAAARLLAVGATGGGHRPRHALLAEAVAAGLLPGERVVLHERTAQALEGRAERGWPRRWPGIGPPRAAPPRSCRPGWRRLRLRSGCSATPRRRRTGSGRSSCARLRPPRRAAGIDVPRLYVRAIDALELSGDSERAGVVAEEAYRRFADHPDPATAAVIHHRAAYVRGIEDPAAGLPLIKEALRLFGQAPPSADHAEAWLDYELIFSARRGAAGGQPRCGEPRAGDRRGIRRSSHDPPHAWRSLPYPTFLRGQVEEGFALLHRARALAEAARAGQGPAVASQHRKRRPAAAGEVRRRRRGRAARPAGRPPRRPGRVALMPTRWLSPQPRRCWPAGARPRQQR